MQELLPGRIENTIMNSQLVLADRAKIAVPDVVENLSALQYLVADLNLAPSVDELQNLTIAIHDVVEDLSELQYLVADLSLAPSADEPQNLIAECQLFHNCFQAGFARVLEQVRVCQRWIEDLVASVANGENLAEFPKRIKVARRAILSLKSTLRSAYRQKGSLFCAQDWQSPPYGLSIPIGTNRLSEGIGSHNLDYKRDGHLDAGKYEEAFIEEYAAHLGSSRLKAYLTNSGMAAFSTVLHLLTNEIKVGGVSVGLRPMYFENEHLLTRFFPEILLFTAQSSPEAIDYLNEKQPSVIFLDAASTRGETFYHVVEEVMQWVVDNKEKPVTLVIDTTCLPSVLLPEGMLTGLPEHISVILIESLAKYHQFGMDIVTGGIILAHAAESTQVHLKKSRQRLGTNISDASVVCLPRPNRSKFIHRLQRQSRNIQLVAEQLEQKIGQPNGIIESIVWLQEPLSVPWYRGTCLTIVFKKKYRSKYNQFEKRVLELSKEQDQPLVLGTSYGFDISRLYVPTPPTPSDEPFLRLAIGTENRMEIEKLVEILLTASMELAEAPPITLIVNTPRKANDSIPFIRRNTRIRMGNAFLSRVHYTSTV